MRTEVLPLEWELTDILEMLTIGHIAHMLTIVNTTPLLPFVNNQTLDGP